MTFLSVIYSVSVHNTFYDQFWRSPVRSRMRPIVPLSAETAHWLEWQDWADPLLRRPYAVKDGMLHIPDIPGISLQWDEDVVAANRADF